MTSELFSPRKGVTILNGVIRNWGWAGVNLDIATGGRLYNLIALGNGGAGLEAGPESTIVVDNSRSSHVRVRNQFKKIYCRC